MNDQTATPDPKGTPPAAEPAAASISSADVRKHPLFEKVTGELAAQKQAIADMQAAQVKAKKDQEMAALEKAQDWDGIKATMEADHAKALAEKEAALVAERLTNKLVLANITHPFAIDAAHKRFVPGEKSMDDFIAEFAETPEVKALVQAATATPATALPGGDATAGAQRSTDTPLEERLLSKDVAVAKAAKDEYLASLMEGVPKG